MSRTKKPSKLSADERAFLDRICSLNEEETEKLSVEEMIAYWNIMHKIDPRWVSHAFEEGFIECGLTNSEVLRQRAADADSPVFAPRAERPATSEGFRAQAVQGPELTR